MESYEEFCSRTLRTLLLSPACSTASQQQRAEHVSTIQFHGRRLLKPVLSEELRDQMAEERQTAIQRDMKRQTRQTDDLLERVQNILNNIHLKRVHCESEQSVSRTAELSSSLQSRMSSEDDIRPASAPLAPQQNLITSRSLKRETLRLLNQRMEREMNPDESSDHPGSPDSVFSGLSLSLTGSYAQLPSPQPSRSPLSHRARRPRAHTAGHILISSPVSESELSTHTAHLSDCSCSEMTDRQLSVNSSTPNSTSSRKEMQRCSLFRSSQDVSHDEKVKPARRSPPAPLNRSYDVESPSPSLIRPQVESTPPSDSSESVSCRLQLEGFSRRPLKERMNIQRHMKGFSRITAMARGFLTRRLLQSDKIKHLRKTVQDSREFLRSFQTDSQLKRVSVSYQDLYLQHRVTAQLRAALHDIHQIFFVQSVKEKLHLLQQDREIHTERTIREMEKVRSSGIRRSLSSATLKTLRRKKHRQTKRTEVMPKTSSASRVVRSTVSQNGVRQLSAVKQREECVEVRQHCVQRKCLSLG